MKYLLEHSKFILYKGLYVTPIILDEFCCRFLDMYDDKTKDAIGDLCEHINREYIEDLVVKMKPNIQPGLIVNSDCDIDVIAIDIQDFLQKRGIESRVVVGEGTVSHFEDDIHRCDIGIGPKGSLLVKIGRMTDSLKGESGIFWA